MKIDTHNSFIFISIFIIFSIVYSQTVTNERFLLDFANDKQNEFLRNQQEIIEFAKLYDIPIRQEQSDGTVIELHHIADGKPYYSMTFNSGAANTTRADEMWPDGNLGLNITGLGYNKLGEWDASGVLLTHQEFGGRVNQGDTPSGTSWHSTHVAGTMIATGLVANAKGMAYEGYLTAYDWNSDLSEMATAAAGGMEISNHSYGNITGWKTYDHGDGDFPHWFGDMGVSVNEDVWFGLYSSFTVAWDNIAYNAPYYLIVKAAGNDRGEHFTGNHYHWEDGWVWASDSHGPDGGTSGYDCIITKSIAKNILTIGAVHEVPNYMVPADVAMSPFSGWGPADDGRIKPDIVGKGVLVYSAHDFGNNYYAYSSGTSMAAPNISGTLALLQQHYQNTHSLNPMLSSTLKGLAIHSAEEAGPMIGPDYMFGWGLMNAEEAGRLISFDSYGNNVIDEKVLSQGATYTRTIDSDGTEPLKVTICWTDPAGTPVSSDFLNNRTPMLVNDLDLKITNGGSTFYPWKLDPDNPSNAATKNSKNNVDNVEQVYIDSPSSGLYKIEVNHDGTLTGGIQAFSIIVSGENHCVNGGIIYNSETNSFNFCEDGDWTEK